MANLKYDKEITALLLIDPYNDFISEGGKVWDRLKGVAEKNSACRICRRFSMPRGRRGSASSTRCIVAIVPATTRPGSTSRRSRRPPGRVRRSNTARGESRRGHHSIDQSAPSLHARLIYVRRSTRPAMARTSRGAASQMASAESLADLRDAARKLTGSFPGTVPSPAVDSRHLNQ